MINAYMEYFNFNVGKKGFEHLVIANANIHIYANIGHVHFNIYNVYYAKGLKHFNSRNSCSYLLLKQTLLFSFLLFYQRTHHETYSM